MSGPKPVYLSNLAAALLKMKLCVSVHSVLKTFADDYPRWDAAESAASRALLHDPRHLKSLYRRALARKEQKRYTGALEGMYS